MKISKTKWSLVLPLLMISAFAFSQSKPSPSIEIAKKFVIKKGYDVPMQGKFDRVYEGVDVLKANKGAANSIRYMILNEGDDPKILIDLIEEMTGKNQWHVNQENYKKYEYKYKNEAYKLGAVKDQKYAIWLEIGDGGMQDKKAILKTFGFDQ